MLTINNRTFIFFVLISLLGISRCYAGEIFNFGPQEAKIDGSIKYSVIGEYKAQFHAFRGRIVFDERSHQVRSVYLEIEVKSVTSNCPWCDKMARSRRLLYAARYPKIIFKSDKIIQDESGYQVKGVLEMRGVKRRLSFPFKVEGHALHGSWVINRKDFNIIWNKYLDRGGILVGDDFTVNWRIRVFEKPFT